MTSSPPEHRIEIIGSRTRFEEIRVAWDRLATSNLFLSWDWLDCWWEHFGEDDELQIHALWEGAGLGGGMALAACGRHGYALANQETDLFQPLGPEREISLIMDGVATSAWSRLTLPAVPLESGMAELLVESLRGNGWLVDQALRERCPIIDTSTSLEEYQGRLSSNARRQLKKARNRLEREGRVDLHAVEKFPPDATLADFLDECFRIEAAGWKGAGGGAVASDPRLLGFWHALLERFRQTGALRVSHLRLDGALIAFCLDVLHEDRLYSMKTSYDEGFAYFSPGHILRMAMIEASIEQGIAAQELLGPMLRWKERYATDERTTVTIRAYRRTPVGLARFLGRRRLLPVLRPVKKGARRALDRVRGRRGAALSQDRAQARTATSPAPMLRRQ